MCSSNVSTTRFLNIINKPTSQSRQPSNMKSTAKNSKKTSHLSSQSKIKLQNKLQREETEFRDESRMLLKSQIKRSQCDTVIASQKLSKKNVKVNQPHSFIQRSFHHQDHQARTSNTASPNLTSARGNHTSKSRQKPTGGIQLNSNRPIQIGLFNPSFHISNSNIQTSILSPSILKGNGNNKKHTTTTH